MTSTISARELALQNQKIGGRYQLVRLITATSYIQIWVVVDDEGRRYSAKLTTLDSSGNSRGFYEAELDVFLTLTRGRITTNCSLNVSIPNGFPNIIFFGRYRNRYDVIVMELLSATVYTIGNDIRWRPLATTTGYLMLLDHMILALMTLHQHGFVHRNVKPHNFRITNAFLPVLLNFSVAKRYIDLATGHHVPMGTQQMLAGSLKYASINAHHSLTQSRRDDLISLGYSIIDVMKRGLPWDRAREGVRHITEVADLVVYVKENTSLEILCHGLPNGVLRYMQTVSFLSYFDTPDYNRLRAMVKPVRNLQA